MNLLEIVALGHTVYQAIRDFKQSIKDALKGGQITLPTLRGLKWFGREGNWEMGKFTVTK